MPGPSRLYPGLFYHIYNRGNNRENIFIEQRNYDYFLRLYEKYITPIADTFAYCLLRNHFHLLVRIKTEEELGYLRDRHQIQGAQRAFNPSQHFANFFNAYAKAINKWYDRSGSLFKNPFGRVQVTSDAHLIHLVAYIHWNPEKHGFTPDFRSWCHSSYPLICSEKRTFLQTGVVISWFYGRENFIAHHDELEITGNIEYLVADD